MRLASRPKVSVDDLALLIEDDLPKNEVYNDNSIFLQKKVAIFFGDYNILYYICTRIND